MAVPVIDPEGVYVVEVNQLDLEVAVPVPVAVPAIVPDGVLEPDADIAKFPF